MKSRVPSGVAASAAGERYAVGEGEDARVSQEARQARQAARIADCELRIENCKLEGGGGLWISLHGLLPAHGGDEPIKITSVVKIKNGRFMEEEFQAGDPHGAQVISTGALDGLRAGQAELVLLDPAEGAAGADEDVAATGAEPAGRVAGGQARQGLGFERGRQPQGSVFL